MNPKALAHAVTAVWTVFYGACVLLTLIVPDFVFGLWTWLVHGLNIQLLKPEPESMNVARIILGGVVWTALVWVLTYVTAVLYKKLR